MTYMSYTNNNQKGFTLLEIIIAMGILAVMTITMTGMTDNIVNRKRITKERNDSRHAVAIALTKFSDDVKMAFQADAKFEGKEKNYVTGFDGDANSLNFSTMSNVHFVKNHRDTDSIEVGYSLEKNDKGFFDLVRRQTNHLMPDLKKGGTSFVLLENVKELEIQYFDSNKKDWKEKWDTGSISAGGRLPQIVKIKLTVLGERLDEDSDEYREYFYELQVPIEMYQAKITF